MRLLALLVPVLALGGIAPQKAGDLELFANGGFEGGLEGWRTLAQSPGAAFELDQKVKASGKASLRIERKADGGWDFLKQYVELEVDEGELRFEMAYRVDKGARLEAVFYFSDASGKTIGRGAIPLVSSGKTRGFERDEKELDVPEGARTCGVDVILKTPGTVWVDDVSLVHVGQGPPELGPLELANPGFDEHAKWWRELAPGSGTLTVELDKREKKAGKAALRLERGSARLYPEDGLRASVTDLGRARRVRLVGHARAAEGARAALALQALDARGAALATARAELPAGAEDFLEHELVLELPKEAARLDVYLLLGGQGRAWFDELELKKR